MEGGPSNGRILGPISLSFKKTSEKSQFGINGVRGRGSPPPFLSKTLVMVEDPETNSIISNSSGTSFIIWDHLAFAKDLLPKYFKHSNFSSFIYQLNNYGFKKIGLKQYEYENEWFQKGRQHLLLNMKRRNEPPKSTRQLQQLSKLCSNEENIIILEELEIFKENINLLKIESQNLKQTNGHLQTKIETFEEQVNSIENKVQKMLNSSSVEQIIENSGEPKSNGKSTLEDNSPTENDLGSRILSDEEVNNNNNSNSETTVAKKCDDPMIIWKKVLEDENEGEKEKKHSEIDMGLNEMMASKIMMEEVEDVIANEPLTDDMNDEVTFQLWE